MRAAEKQESADSATPQGGNADAVSREIIAENLK